MKCPYCGAEESKVIDSRPTEDSERIRRRRECLSCHMRFTTFAEISFVFLRFQTHVPISVELRLSAQRFDKSRFPLRKRRRCISDIDHKIESPCFQDNVIFLRQDCHPLRKALSDLFLCFACFPVKYYSAMLS